MKAGDAGREAAELLLLRALDPEPERFTSLPDAVWLQADWDWLLDRSEAHKVAALLAARIARHPLTPPIPDEVQARLLGLREAAEIRAEQSRFTLLQLAQAFRGEEITFVVAKGSCLSEYVYDDPADRPFYDIDILVLEESMDRAEELLLSLGYFFYHPMLSAKRPDGKPPVSREKARALIRRHHRHFSYVLPSSDQRRPVDLHWNLIAPKTIRVTPSLIWEHTRPLTLAGIPLRALTDEAALVHTAIHAMDQGPLVFKLLHLCDVAWSLHRLGNGLEPAALDRVVDRWGARRHLESAIAAVDLVFEPEWSWPASVAGRAEGWSRTCLSAAEVRPLLVEPRLPTTKLRAIGARLHCELLWDLALGSMPRRATRTLSDVLLDPFRRLSLRPVKH